MTLNRFLLYFLFFNIALAAPPLAAEVLYSSQKLLIPHFWALFLIFDVLTLQLFLFAFWRMRISYKASGQAILASVSVKLLFCMILAFIYLYNVNTDKTKFLVNFFYLYFFHSVFEIYSLLRNLRNQNFK